MKGIRQLKKEHFYTDQVKISQLLESNKLTQHKKGDQSESKVSTMRMETKDATTRRNNDESTGTLIEREIRLSQKELRYEQHANRRNKYFDNYFHALQQVDTKVGKSD
jgi:hypothetical protein